MKIYKKLNNNAVLSKDERHMDIVVTGTGIAYGKSLYDEIDSDKILQIYSPANKQQRNKFELMVEEIPIEFFVIAERVREIATTVMGMSFDDSLSLHLADHLHFAVERYREGIETPNLMLTDIKRFYAKEFEAGQYAVDYINAALEIELDENEAGFIAFHIASCETDGGNAIDFSQLLDMLEEIIESIESYFDVYFDADSMAYGRLVTHLKFFLTRALYEKETAELEKSPADDQLYQILVDKYASIACYLDELARYVEQRCGYTMSDQDRMYLLIHLARLIV